MSSAPSAKSSRNKVLKSARFSYNTSAELSHDEDQRGGHTIRQWQAEASKNKPNFLMRKCSLSERAQAFASQECPYCQRKFARKAAQRHIQMCQQKHKNSQQPKKTHKFLANSQDKAKKMAKKSQSVNNSIIKLSHVQMKTQETPRFKERDYTRKRAKQSTESVSNSLHLPSNRKKPPKINRSMIEPPQIQRHQQNWQKYSETEGPQEYPPSQNEKMCMSARHNDERKVRFEGGRLGKKKLSLAASPMLDESREEESSKHYAAGQQEYLITDASVRGMSQAEKALFQTIEQLCKRNSVRKAAPPIFSKEKKQKGKLALFCTQCGSAFGTDDNFCGHCGQRRLIT